jgi:acetate kinase
MNILVFNAGSSSLKISLIESAGEQVQAEGLIDYAVQPPRLRLRRAGQPDLTQDASSPDQDLTRILSLLPTGIAAVGHRVVHGGSQFVRSVRVTPA